MATIKQLDRLINQARNYAAKSAVKPVLDFLEAQNPAERYDIRYREYSGTCGSGPEVTIFRARRILSGRIFSKKIAKITYHRPIGSASWLEYESFDEKKFPQEKIMELLGPAGSRELRFEEAFSAH